MFTVRAFKPLSAAMVGLAVLCAPASRAETLIYVTDTKIGTVDSGTAAADNTSGKSSGPLNYSLPNGSTLIGARVSLENQTLYLLVVNSGMCQLYSANTSGSGGNASLTAVNASYACAPPLSTGDFAFINGSGGSSGTDSYLVASGASVLQVPAGGGTASSIAISNPAGGNAEIWGLADVGTSPGDTRYGVDAATQELFQLNLNADGQTGSETNVVSAPVTFSGSTSFDYSTGSGTFYLYSGGVLYAYGGLPYPNNLSAGAFSILGAVPGGTLAIAAANGASVTNNSGALTPATLLPLLALGLLRRRRLVQASCRIGE